MTIHYNQRIKRIKLLLSGWQQDGYIIHRNDRWAWTTKAKRRLTPVLTVLAPTKAAAGVDDGSLGVILD